VTPEQIEARRRDLHERHEAGTVRVMGVAAAIHPGYQHAIRRSTEMKLRWIAQVEGWAYEPQPLE